MNGCGGSCSAGPRHPDGIFVEELPGSLLQNSFVASPPRQFASSTECPCHPLPPVYPPPSSENLLTTPAEDYALGF
uniref:Uncharacterized protein n=1 Tax=Ascaris lumbricoides TaxID=6252 RepID=A0A0M3HWY0_ASCLU